MAELINHKDLGESRLATQFKNSTKLIAYLRVLLNEADTIEQVLHDILNKRWIDTAEGEQLDILGSIVGQSREFIDAEIFSYFGFGGNAQSQSFGTLLDISKGGRWRSLGEAITGKRFLSDNEYRVFIRAKIIRNKTRSTPEDIIAQLLFVWPAPQILFNDGDTFYEVSVGRKLTLNEKAIILYTDIIPKTVGVSVSYVTEYDYDSFFGFAGIPNSEGFGSVNNAALGGKFGNLIF